MFSNSFWSFSLRRSSSACRSASCAFRFSSRAAEAERSAWSLFSASASASRSARSFASAFASSSRRSRSSATSDAAAAARGDLAALLARLLAFSALPVPLLARQPGLLLGRGPGGREAGDLLLEAAGVRREHPPVEHDTGDEAEDGDERRQQDRLEHHHGLPTKT